MVQRVRRVQRRRVNAEALDALIVAHRVSERSLEELTGVPRFTIHQLRTGRTTGSRLSDASWDALAGVFSVSVDVITWTTAGVVDGRATGS